MESKWIIPEPKSTAIMVDGKKILSKLTTWEIQRPEPLRIYVLGIPVTINQYTTEYYGRYHIKERKIEIDIPTNWHDADKLVILYILLHEIAHYRQHVLAGKDLFYLRYPKMHITKGQEGLLPREVAANKHAVRALVKIGIPPSAIDASLCSALGPECFTRTGHKYRQYRWMGRYFRARTCHTS